MNELAQLSGLQFSHTEEEYTESVCLTEALLSVRWEESSTAQVLQVRE